MHNPIAPAPVTAPQQPDRQLKPVIAEPPAKPPSRVWLWVLLLGIVGGAAWWLFQRNLGAEAVAQKRAAAATRVTTVHGGKVVDSIRMSGTTGPEKFVTILGPQLRGSRSFSGGGGAFMGRGGGRSSGGSSGGSSSGGSSSGGSSGGGSSSSASTSTSGSSAGSVSGTVASTSSSASAVQGGAGGGAIGSSTSGGGSTGGVRSSANAMRSATSRTGSGGSRGSGNALSTGAAQSSGSLGGDGLGSTSGSLFGGGGGGSTGGGGGGSGGGGRGGDFGAVLQDLVAAGGMVKKGERVAEFDRQYMLQRVDDYEAGVVQQELNFKNQQASIEQTRAAHDQSIAAAKGLVEKSKLDLKTVPVRGAIEAERFKLALEEAEAQYKQLLAEVPYVRAGERSQLRISQLDLEQAKLEMKRSEVNAERMVVKAPMGGMAVMMRMFRGGEFGQVQVGDPVPSGFPFMQVVDTSSMVVNALMNQVDVEKLRVGQKTKIRFDAFPDLELPGHVYSIAAMPKSSFSARANYLKEIPVTVRLDKMDPRVIPDLSVSVDVMVAEEEAAVVVPLSALFHEGDNKQAFVFVKKGEGDWERRTVQTGLASQTTIAVRGGLKEGEVIAEDRPEMPAAGGKSASAGRRRQGPMFAIRGERQEKG